MTDTLPAKTSEAGVAQIAPREYSQLKDQARAVVKSGLAPKSVNTPAEKVLVIAMKGRELGVPMMQALSQIHIVEGKPTISAELMVALVQRAGHKLRVLETSSEKCVVEGARRDDPEYPQRLEWSMDDARKAGVAGKNTWKNYPAAMLRARAISALCRFAFADVLMGASYTPEELGAEVDEEGQILDAEPVQDGRDEEQVVEAEGETFDSEHDEILGEIVHLYGELPADVRPENWEEVFAYAGESWEKAVAVKKRLSRKLEEASEAAGEE